MVAPPWLPVPPVGYGGTEVVVDTLARGLAAEGHEVLLVAHPESTCPVERAAVVPAKDAVRMGRAAIELEHAVGAHAMLSDCDVVHDHTLAGALFGGLRAGPPVVTTNHQPFDRPRVTVLAAVAERVGVIAISRSHASSTTLPIAGIVHHGVDVGDFPVGSGAGGYAAVLGRMTPDKGVHRAVAVARAAGVPLRIAAKMREPHEREYFDEFVRPHLGGDVEFLGEVSGTDKLDLLADAVALLNPVSWAEPFGMVMVESMACGTPVVACPVGSAPELVDHGRSGFLGADDAQLAAGLASAPSLDRAVVRRHVADRFGVDRMVAGYLALYERWLQRGAAS